MGVTTRAAWWLLAAGACREAVERLGRLNVAEARAAATDDELAWARGGDGGGNGFGGGGGGGFGGGGGGSFGGGNGFGDGGGFGVGSGSGGGFGDDDGCIGDGFGDGDRRGDGSTSADIISITIDGETLTPAECRERVRRWAM